MFTSSSVAPTDWTFGFRHISHLSVTRQPPLTASIKPMTVHSHISTGAEPMFACMYGPHIPTATHTDTCTYSGADKATIKPTRAFLLWILIHFSTQPVSISARYLLTPHSLSLHLHSSHSTKKNDTDGLICVNADGGENSEVQCS